MQDEVRAASFAAFADEVAMIAQHDRSLACLLWSHETCSIERVRLNHNDRVRFVSMLRLSKSGCFLWQGARNQHGYGVFVVEGRQLLAHRVALQLERGRPPGKLVRHLCGRAACCNPAHLTTGTHQQNAADRRAHGRDPIGSRNGQRRHPERTARGEHVGSARLTASQVETIRRLYRRHAASMPELAKRYGVNKSTISRLVSRETW
jgi:hypothetical protein